MDKESMGNVESLLKLSTNESYKLKHDYIGTEHILLAFMQLNSEETELLISAGANYENLKEVVVSGLGYGESLEIPTGLTPRVKRLMERSREVAKNTGHSFVRTEHIFYCLLDDEDAFSSYMLTKTGVSKVAIIEKIKKKIEENRKLINDDFDEYDDDEELSYIEKYSVNLNEKAKDGKIDPVIGRDKELERLIQILLRRTKNNPILLGEPGVGKTAIAEGLAKKIVSKNVPDIMLDKVIVSLDLPGMLAGTKFRGDFEERIKMTINELGKRDEVILFIDEFHTLVGAGGAEGAIDAANILKPVLGRGDLQVIGATTIDEYRKYVEKDSALERRLQPIMVDEPSIDDSIDILKGLKSRYEEHHNVTITDSAIESACELTDRYLADRFLPDKAIDVIDEAASKMRIEHFTSPPDFKVLNEKLEKLIDEKNVAVNMQNFEKAADLRDRIKTIKKEIDEKKENWKDINKKTDDMIIGFNEVADIVSEWSNVPVSNMTEEESVKYLNLDKKLKKIVIGQDNAIESITKAIKRARVGLKDPEKPIGTFIFVGPTGVGKTYLAKSLSKELFGSEETMIRIDMSEYMEKHSVAKLIGSPPGYVGHDEGGQLTEAVRRNPYSVVLFDEIEKAHPDVFNALLQVLDDGRLTDSRGKTVDFKNTVIILTSNVGASLLQSKNTLGFSANKDKEKEEYEKNKDIIMDALKDNFKPEFLNRVDDIVIFKNLSQKDIDRVSKIMLDKMIERLSYIDIKAKYDKKLVEFISKKGFDKTYGARPLERVITSMIENSLAEEILSGNIKRDDEILITVKYNKIKFEKTKKKELLESKSSL